MITALAERLRELSPADVGQITANQVAQAFVLVLVPLFWGSDLLVYRIVAVLLGVAALGGLALALRPAVRQSLT